MKSFGLASSHGAVLGAAVILAVAAPAYWLHADDGRLATTAAGAVATPRPAAGVAAAIDAGVNGVAPAARPPFDAGELQTIDAILALGGDASTSIGGPNTGHVLGSVALPMRGPGFRFGPLRDPIARFGTVETVQSLMRAAAMVERSHPGSELTINDLGLASGGPIPHHGSHRAGRDVDVLFFVLDAAGAPRSAVGAPIEPDGTGTDYRDLAVAEDDVTIRLDVPRSWAFVEATLRDDAAVVQRIFLVEHVRTMLLEHAQSIHADAAIVQRFADVTCQPEYPHDDHFHYRYFCTPEDVRGGCTDSAPIYPWHREALERVGLAPVMQRRRAEPSETPAPAARVTTEAQARAAAGAMHPDVTAFLARRDRWRRQPHPGRTYCR
jgi:penicillin-insensitive murein endopeptidase